MGRLEPMGWRMGAVGRRMVGQGGKVESERTTEKEDFARLAEIDRA